MKPYIELDVWIEARKLASEIYGITGSFLKQEQYGIVSQIRRSVVSIASTISEGCGRNSSKETIHFLHGARGSLYEVETQLYISYDLNYLDKQKLNNLLEQILICKKLINGFINYYRKL